ncbi:MIP aquaporin-like protein [Aureococcus anophagefferens]|nr:MIP aquaporin-like protein [Aureococcus anophagefferens]
MDLVEDCYGYACKGPVAAAIILCLVAAPIGQGKSLVKAWWNECYGAAIMIAATFSPGKWGRRRHGARAGDAPGARGHRRDRAADWVLHEFGATLLLCLGVFAICLESPFKDIYPLKITCVAALIRFLIVYLGAAGPAINPMLATTWALYATGSFPTFYQHYLVYWAAPLAAAVTAGLPAPPQERRDAGRCASAGGGRPAAPARGRHGQIKKAM